MKLTIKTNFSFGKLADSMPDLIDDYLGGYAKEAEKGTKENIDKGLSPDLEESTIQTRQHRGQPTDKPLYATGRLYSSIKANKNTLSMKGYGKLHHDGFSPKKIPVVGKDGDVKTKGNKIRFKKNTRNIAVPARPFISTTAKEAKKLADNFFKAIRKRMRK